MLDGTDNKGDASGQGNYDHEIKYLRDLNKRISDLERSFKVFTK